METNTTTPANPTLADFASRADALIWGLVNGKLSEGDARFAKSLCDWQAKGRAWSAKQDDWVNKLVDRALNGYPKPRETEVGSLRAVDAIFARAKASGLKRPKIKFTAGEPDTITLELSVAGARARVPGSLNVTSGGRYGESEWYGRIVDGMFQAAPRTGNDQVTRVVAALTDLATDPLRALTRSGHLTGNCACCNRKLTDPESVKRGIGPVCAAKYLGA